MTYRPILPTRGRSELHYFVITPDNWVDNALPHFERAIVRPMITPRASGANFAQYFLDLEPSGGSSRPVGAGFEHFLYQLQGEVVVETPERVDQLTAGDFCFLPAGSVFSVKNEGPERTRTFWTKRRYEEADGIPSPEAIYGTQSAVPTIVPDPPAAYVYQELIPTTNRSHDMAMNILTCRPGGSLALVEIHHQEHGLLMLSGRGIYYLGGECHDVCRDDFIYMAPYCPQSFWATGEETASYLLYKDVNRDGF
jgi:(S)-ureidoglycine aminohydrolase